MNPRSEQHVPDRQPGSYDDPIGCPAFGNMRFPILLILSAIAVGLVLLSILVYWLVALRRS